MAIVATRGRMLLHHALLALSIQCAVCAGSAPTFSVGGPHVRVSDSGAACRETVQLMPLGSCACVQINIKEEIARLRENGELPAPYDPRTLHDSFEWEVFSG